MKSYTASSSQRSALKQFKQFTQASEDTAIKILQANNWNVEIAIDSYYQNPTGNSSTYVSRNPEAVGAIFDSFRGPGDASDTLSIEGTLGYFKALDLMLDDPTVLAISKELSSPQLGEFKRQGFVDGWVALGADSMERMKGKLEELRTRLDTDNDYFKQVYLWTFDWAKAAEQRGIPHDTAIELWRQLFSGRFQGHLDHWIEYIETKWKRNISRDMWNMLHDFVNYATKEDPTLEKYDDMSSWPSVIDGYVDYYKGLPK